MEIREKGKRQAGRLWKASDSLESRKRKNLLQYHGQIPHKNSFWRDKGISAFLSIYDKQNVTGTEQCHRVRVGLTKTQRQSKFTELCILIKAWQKRIEI